MNVRVIVCSKCYTPYVLRVCKPEWLGEQTWQYQRDCTCRPIAPAHDSGAVSIVDDVVVV